MKHRFVQMTPKGMWMSAGVFDDPIETIVANVVRAHVPGQPRAAISSDDHRVIFAIDDAGRAIEPEAFHVNFSKVA